MNTHRDLGPRVRTWLHGRLSERPDPYPILDEVLSQLPTTPQRRHLWWPFPASTWRANTMFSAVKLTVAAAVIAVAGSFLAVGLLPGDETGGGVPAAQTGATWPDPSTQALTEAGAGQVAVVHFEVGLPPSDTLFIYQPGTVTYGDGVSFHEGMAAQWVVRASDDPRISGTLRSTRNGVDFLDSSSEHLFSETMRIDAEAGSWIGSGHGFWADAVDNARHHRQALLHGTGAHEGLSLLLFETDGQVTGIIFPDATLGTPAVPEPAPAE